MHRVTWKCESVNFSFGTDNCFPKLQKDYYKGTEKIRCIKILEFETRLSVYACCICLVAGSWWEGYKPWSIPCCFCLQTRSAQHTSLILDHKAMTFVLYILLISFVDVWIVQGRQQRLWLTINFWIIQFCNLRPLWLWLFDSHWF